MTSITVNKILKKALPIIAWLIIWQLVAVLVHNHILLAGPFDTLKALMGLIAGGEFWNSILQTSLRIILGFLIGSVLGIAAAFLAYSKEIFADFLKPFVVALKSVPVASFVILLLIWFGSGNISIIICAMVVFPILYLNTLEGLRSTSVELLEMSHVFRMPLSSKIRFIYLPQLRPFFKGAFKLAVGMSFKSGIAAEVIGQPLNTIGNGIYLSKIYLETGELFAWTIIVVLIAFICEKIIGKIIDLI